MKRKINISIKTKIVGCLIVVFMIILFINHKIFSAMGLRSTVKLSNDTIRYAKEKLETYDNYQANDETKSLVRLLDKTTELAKNLNIHKYTEKALNTYACEQHLTGIIVLDSNLKTVMQTTTDGNTYRKWENILQSDSVKEIIKCPKKYYMTTMENCDIAAISRLDGEGIIMSYVVQNSINESVNDITPEDIFSGMMLQRKGILFITDENGIVASNTENISKNTINNFDNIWKKSKNVRGILNKAKINNRKWYMKKAEYKDYVIHVMFPVLEVFKPYYFAELVIIICYFLVCGIIFILYCNIERRNYKKLRKYYQTIEAVNSAYMADLLVDVESGQSEWIKIPDIIRNELDGISDVRDIMKKISDIYVNPSYFSQFFEFTDISTIRKRLADKRIISYTYEDIFGEWITIEIVPQDIDESKKLKAVLYIIRNVTEEMKKEKDYQKQLKLADEAKTNFLRRMSHDIRTPINGIRGIIEIANHNREDLEKQQEYRDKIKTASGYLLDLINNVLDMSKLESSDIKLEHKAFDIVELLHKSNEIIMMQCNECGITYNIEEGRIIHTALIGSPLHFQQVLMNIAGNAVKYNSENGSIFVKCTEVSSDENIADFELVCRDTGIGMSEDFQKRIFEPFSQENENARTKYAGTGLGMAIAKELIELQGGSIELKSKEGDGTEFKIKISFEIDHLPVRKKNNQNKEKKTLEGTRILLTEDNDLNMEVAEFMLKNKGAEITKAWNGKEAVEIFKASQEGYFDVILMDIMMPVMGGLEAARNIRKLEREDASKVLIVAMTANAFQDDMEKSIEAGMDAHITKPLNMDELLDVVCK